MSKKASSKSFNSKPFTVYVGAKSLASNSCSKCRRYISDVTSYTLSVGKWKCSLLNCFCLSILIIELWVYAKLSDLDELKSCPTTIVQPMREVDPSALQILYNSADRSSGKTYLTKRLDQSPRQKYFFPEATSWRIGWIQNQWYVKNVYLKMECYRNHKNLRTDFS